jgi:hypothetical protein
MCVKQSLLQQLAGWLWSTSSDHRDNLVVLLCILHHFVFRIRFGFILNIKVFVFVGIVKGVYLGSLSFGNFLLDQNSCFLCCFSDGACHFFAVSEWTMLLFKYKEIILLLLLYYKKIAAVTSLDWILRRVSSLYHCDAISNCYTLMFLAFSNLCRERASNSSMLIFSITL